MFTPAFHSPVKALLLGGAALSLAACGSSGSYRVASVGSVGPAGSDGANGSTGSNGSDGGTGAAGGTGATGGTGSTGGTGGTGSAGGTGSTGANGVAGRVLVTAGNTVIGVSSKHNSLAQSINGLAPGTTQITGAVTTVLRKTGQSLVDLGNGQSLILNGRGKLGEIVNINLLSRTVTGASAGSSLLGVSVLSPNIATGSLAAVNVGNNGQLLTVGNGAAGNVLSPVNGVLAPVTGVVNGVTGGATGGVTGNVTGSVTGGASTTGATGQLGNVVGGVVGGLTGAIPH